MCKGHKANKESWPERGGEGAAGNQPVVNSDLMAMAGGSCKWKTLDERSARWGVRVAEATARSTVLNCPSAMHSARLQQILVHLPRCFCSFCCCSERKWKWLRAVYAAFAAASQRAGYVYVLRMLLRGFNRLMAAAAATSPSAARQSSALW